MEPEPEARETAEPEPGPEAGETELVNESDSEDDSGNPGVVIIYTNADTVHTALGQGSVANIVLPTEIGPNVPVLQQGTCKLKAYLLVY